GLSFKPKTDDVREAPAITIINLLKDMYASVAAYDPEASAQAKAVLTGVDIVDNAYAALEGAHALLVLTEWDEFRTPDWGRMKAVMASPIIIDGRNIYDPVTLRDAGWTYRSVGR
ncbi:MAG: UDP-glucose/GDP-mannose dehydrogenase family protein, partial [Nanoarchaeota archaeon]